MVPQDMRITKQMTDDAAMGCIQRRFRSKRARNGDRDQRCSAS